MMPSIRTGRSIDKKKYQENDFELNGLKWAVQNDLSGKIERAVWAGRDTFHMESLEEMKWNNTCLSVNERLSLFI